MVLSAPNSMALTSNENIHVIADGQISQTADDSINLSTQKNFIAHAQNKISFCSSRWSKNVCGQGQN